METLEYLIDYTSMSSVYYHAITNPDFTGILQVHGNREFMGQIGEAMTREAGLPVVLEAYKQGKLTLMSTPIDGKNGVYALALPPFYLIIDTGQSYNNS